MSLGLLVSSLPWWIAAPLVQLAVLLFGMALDETYVNRTTVLTGAIAVQIHGFVAGDVGLLVALYGDLGLMIGAYGVYAYVVDGYVGNWFRLLAYFVYSPLSAFLVILAAGPTLFGVEPLVVPALALAGYANLQLREYLRPREPYYFGPQSREAFEAVVETETATGAGPADPAVEPDGTPNATNEVDGGTDGPTGSTAEESENRSREDTGSNPDATVDGEPTTPPSADAREDADSFEEPTAEADDLEFPGAEPTAADSSERGILPKFMRRL